MIATIRSSVKFDFRIAPPPREPVSHGIRGPKSSGQVTRSRQVIRVWQDKLAELKAAPFPVDESALFVAFSVGAELSCFAALGWPFPRKILDLYAEFHAITN